MATSWEAFWKSAVYVSRGLGYLTQNSMPLLPLFVSEMAWTVFLESNFTNCSPGIPYVAAKRLRIGTENRQGHEGIRLKEFSALGTAEPVPQSLGTQGFQRSSNLEPHIIDRREP